MSTDWPLLITSSLHGHQHHENAYFGVILNLDGKGKAHALACPPELADSADSVTVGGGFYSPLCGSGLLGIEWSTRRWFPVTLRGGPFDCLAKPRSPYRWAQTADGQRIPITCKNCLRMLDQMWTFEGVDE